MWSVLRRYQGVEYDEGTRGRAATVARRHNIDPLVVNQRSIALHECRPNPKAQDPSVLAAPYGDNVYDKLMRHLRHESVSMRRKALLFLLELYTQKQEHVVASLRESVVTILCSSLRDEDEEVRANACAALQFVAQQPNGQNAILADPECLEVFLQTIEDASTIVVAEALRLCCAMHSAYNDCAGTKALVKRGAIAKYVARASSPEDEVAASAFAAITKTFDVKEAYIELLDNGGLEPMTQAVNSRTDPVVLVEALECIGKMAFYSAGKRAAVHQHTVRPVIQLVAHEDVAIRTAASGALVALTISEQGKLEAIGEGNVVTTLLQAVRVENERDVLVNEIKTLCNVSEHPVARLQLFEIIPRLEEIAQAANDQDPHGSLMMSIQRAIAMIRWKPGDHIILEQSRDASLE